MQSTMIIRLFLMVAITTMSVVMAIGGELSCVDDKSFVFVHTNKNGRSKRKEDGCKFAARKRKKRCRKKINGVKVKDYCPAACGICSAKPIYCSHEPNKSCYRNGYPSCCDDAVQGKCPKKKAACTIVSGKHPWLDDLSRNAVSPAPLIMVMENDGDEGGSDSSPISPLSSSPISPLSKFTVQWSESIIESGFDNSRKIEEGCKNLIRTDSSDPSEVFACRLWFPSEKSMQPIALGPLKMATNLVTSYTDQGYKKSDVTQIFTSNALASMIEKRCFYFDTGQQVYISNSVEFTDESSFEASVKSGDSISIEAQVGYGPVAISAGYSQSSQVATTNSGNRKTAYGEKRYFKNIGVLDNLCLSANRVQDIKSLVKAEWVDKWSFIRNFQGSAEQLTKTQQFIDVAKAGLVIPKTYEYGAAISYEILSTYVYTSSESAEKMSQAISAGVSGSAGAGSASVSTNVEKTMETATKDTSLNAKTTVKLNVFGNNIDSACMKDDDCNKEMNEKVNEIVNDFNKAGYPYKADITIGLVDFVKHYFDDGKPGFPNAFKQAMEMYYTVQRCKNPGGGNGCNEFTTTNGAGNSIGSRTYCPTNQFCSHARISPNQVNDWEDLLCKYICPPYWAPGNTPCIDEGNTLNGC